MKLVFWERKEDWLRKYEKGRMKQMEEELGKEVRKLFNTGKIGLFIGYEEGTVPFRARPSFADSAEDADLLVWDVRCGGNLAVYLPPYFAPDKKNKDLPVIGIAAKGCDLRSILELVKEKQLPRENIVIVGLPCAGIADMQKLRAIAGGDNYRTLTFDGNEFKKDGEIIAAERYLSEACLVCSCPDPPGADVVVAGKKRGKAPDGFKRVAELEEKSAGQRWSYFEKQISKCIRCYACRQACPNCYCKVCFAEQTTPAWIKKGLNSSDIGFFHIGRIFHQAGRCTGCDACVRACPMGLDLRVYTQKLIKDVNELFGYTPGMTPGELPLLCTFTNEDNQDFISEP